MIHSLSLLHLTSSSRSRLQGFRLLSNECDGISQRQRNLNSAVSLSVENSEQDARRSPESTRSLQNTVSTTPCHLWMCEAIQSKASQTTTAF